MLRSKRQSAQKTKQTSKSSTSKAKRTSPTRPFSTFKKVGKVTPQPPPPQPPKVDKQPAAAAPKQNQPETSQTPAPPTPQPTPTEAVSPEPQAPIKKPIATPEQTQSEPVQPKKSIQTETTKTTPVDSSSSQVSPTLASTSPTPVLPLDDKPKTAILMLNMGGPKEPTETKSFLTNLFSDPMIINLGKFQWAGIRAAASRTPKVQKQYETIGGSPIAKWTDLQGKSLTSVLDIISPQTAPHKHYIGFRYANPMTRGALEQIKKDGVKRVVAFSQFPMYSCTTTGSSLNDLWRTAQEMGLDLDFSVIDRWHDDDNFHTAIAQNIYQAVAQIPAEELQSTAILFSAHSVPLKTMNQGDQYPAEVSHTVEQTMVKFNKLLKDRKPDAYDAFSSPNPNAKLPHMLCWQSKVGFLPWLQPSTSTAIEKVKSLGFKQAVIVPVAFTSDHIETLHEIDIEYKELAEKHGLKLLRAESLNNSMFLTKAQAHIVKEHLDNNEIVRSHQYRIRCNECIQPEICRSVLGYDEKELFINKRIERS